MYILVFELFFWALPTAGLSVSIFKNQLRIFKGFTLLSLTQTPATLVRSG